MAEERADGDGLDQQEPAEPVTASGAESEGYVPSTFDRPDPGASENLDINLELVLEVPVSLALHVGQTTISIRELMNLVEGSVVELDRLAADPMDVLINGTLVARGEIVVVNDNFGVRLTEVVSPADRVRKLN